MTIVQQILIVAAGTFATMITRFVPFIAFRSGRLTPKYILYLGKVLPASVFAMLVVYCLRDTISTRGLSMLIHDPCGLANWHQLFSSDALQQFIAVSVTILIHFWKRNLMLSIAFGTVCYMLLIRIL